MDKLAKHKAYSDAGHLDRQHVQSRDWRRAMSVNVAYGLLVYTGLQIFVTVHSITETVSGLMPYVLLVLMVALIIPAFRWFEARWKNLSDQRAHDPALAPAFYRDVTGLWLIAIGLPLALTALQKFISAI